MPLQLLDGQNSIANSKPLWRYVDLFKLVDLIEHRSLHFTRLDQMPDPMEAWLPEDLLQFEDDLVEAATQEIMRRIKAGAPPPSPPANSRKIRLHDAAEQIEDTRRGTVASCWFEADVESVSMWQLYAGQAGLAVGSSVLGLQTALARSSQTVLMGRVHYFQPGLVPIDKLDLGTLIMGMTKQAAYQDEHEVRLIIRSDDGLPATGVRVTDIDVDALCERFVVSPFAKDFEYEAIANVLTMLDGKMGSRLASRLAPSDLFKHPRKPL